MENQLLADWRQAEIADAIKTTENEKQMMTMLGFFKDSFELRVTATGYECQTGNNMQPILIGVGTTPGDAICDWYKLFRHGINEYMKSKAK